VRLVLASASPARLRVLQAAGLSPEVVVSGVDEDAVEGSPEHVASTLAAHKAEAVAARLGGGAAVVVGCDSVLDLDGEPLGKPSSAADAARRWEHMRGRTGHLLTGHCLIRTDTQRRAATVVRTKVTFGRPSDDEIAAYVATGEPQQVAGAFTIDGYGGWFVDRLEGDPSNVIGISLPAVRGLLAQLDVPVTTLW
jgi:septum formation protein